MQTSFLLLSLGVCLIVILILSIKLYLIRKSADEMKDAFADRLKNETNTLIDISGNDAHMRTLASSINEELKALRTLRHKFWQGDLEVKDAITGVSHDLRTPLTSIAVDGRRTEPAPHAAVLEVTLFGGMLEFTEDTIVAVT